jgi:hypothetical protein
MNQISSKTFPQSFNLRICAEISYVIRGLTHDILKDERPEDITLSHSYFTLRKIIYYNSLVY